MLADQKVEALKEKKEDIKNEPPKSVKEKYSVTTNSKTGLTEEEEKKIKRKFR